MTYPTAFQNPRTSMEDFTGRPRMNRHATWQSSVSDGSPSLQKTHYEYAEVPLTSPRTRGKHIRDFKPFAHRTLSLLILAVIVLGLIGALEYGMRMLPQTSLEPNSSSNTSVGLYKRNERWLDTLVVASELEKRLPTTTNGPVAVATSTRPPSDYLNPEGTTIRSVPTALSSSLRPTVLPTRTSSAYLNPTSGATIVISTRPSSLYVQPGSTIITASQAFVSDSAKAASESLLLSHSDAANSISHAGSQSHASSLKSIVASAPAPTRYLTPTVSVQYLTSTYPYDPESSSSDLPPVDVPPNLKDSKLPLTLVSDAHNYFLGTYLPVLIAVVIRLMFSYLHRSTKLVDPFFMLNQAEGIAAYDFFRADHLGNESVLAPFYALRSRRWLMLWTSITYAAAQLLTPFAAELTTIYDSNYTFRIPDGVAIVRGQAFWINPVIGRLLQGLLSFVFIMVFLIWFLLRKHKSGVATSPASIGAIASLVDHPVTTDDFSLLDQKGSKEYVAKVFADRRYKLGYYFSSDGTERYGIVPVQVVWNYDEQSEYARNGSFAPYAATQTPQLLSGTLRTSTDFNASTSKRPRVKDVIPLLLLTSTSIALFGVILAYFINGELIDFEIFMDSESFGPRFVLSVLGMLVKSPLLSLCAKLTASVPFARLSEHPRSANLDLLSTVPLTPLGAIWFSFKRQRWFAAILAICGGILIECLLIVIPGVPFHTNQIWTAARASWFLSFGVLSVFILVAFTGWIRLFRSVAEYQWPLSPGRIGAVCSYVAGTRMSADQAASLSAAEGAVGAHGKDNVAEMWRRDVTSWAANYDFKLRGRRWVVEYLDVGVDEEQVGQGLQAASPVPGQYLNRHASPVPESYVSRYSSMLPAVPQPDQQPRTWPLPDISRNETNEMRRLMPR